MEIIASMIIAILYLILFYGNTIGISMVIFTLISTGVMWFILYKKEKVLNKKAIILMIPIILLSSTYFIFANTTFYIMNIIIISILSLMMFAIAINKEDFFRNYLNNTFILIINAIRNCKIGIAITKKYTSKTISKGIMVNKNNIKKLIKSLFIVLVIVGIIIILLASADTVFASIFSGLGNIYTNINIRSLILRFLIIIIAYIISLSLIITIEKKNIFNKNNHKQKEFNNDNFTIKMLLIVLNIVYLVFCYIQINTLFKRISLSETFNYAQYARSGFFQLMFVSLINFALILISNKNNNRREKSIKILNIILIIFTVIIALSSIYRMYMYSTEYGLTYSRIFVFIILATELVTFVPTIIYMFNQKFDLLKWVAIIGICAYVGINFVNLENIIITENINRRKSRVSIDCEYICKIASCDSYEILEKALDNNNIESSDKINILNKLLKIVNSTNNLKWQEFNFSKYKVKNKKIDIDKLKEQMSSLKEEEKNKISTLDELGAYYIYEKMINEIEGYRVNQLDSVTGHCLWRIEKTNDGGNSYTKVNTIEVTSPSKIEFFENGLGFLEQPTNIYCGKSNLYITYDYGKNFEKIEFPSGKFSLSNSEGKSWKECYDYYYLPTVNKDENLEVLVSGGYEGGYNEGKTRAKYISTDNGKTWIFVSEIYK